jgi:N-methylhydantoinase B/oxoprolinase/acetone carboxylase alpha subunit
VWRGEAKSGYRRPISSRILRADGSAEELRTADKREVGPGDTWLLETLGGGGYLAD